MPPAPGLYVDEIPLFHAGAGAVGVTETGAGAAAPLPGVSNAIWFGSAMAGEIMFKNSPTTGLDNI
ncbi:MAG: hypothetical protein Q7R41_19245, partial [Phycisphaerales bacterium]|nr:hypothetical protein [Phycisphaerales bacterium]